MHSSVLRRCLVLLRIIVRLALVKPLYYLASKMVEKKHRIGDSKDGYQKCYSPESKSVVGN